MKKTYIQKVLESNEISNILNNEEIHFLESIEKFSNEFIDVFYRDGEDFIEHLRQGDNNYEPSELEDSTIVAYITFIKNDDDKHKIELGARMLNACYYQDLTEYFGGSILDEGREIIQILKDVNPHYFNLDYNDEGGIIIGPTYSGEISLVLDPLDFKNPDIVEVPHLWICEELKEKMEQVLSLSQENNNNTKKRPSIR